MLCNRKSRYVMNDAIRVQRLQLKYNQNIQTMHELRVAMCNLEEEYYILTDQYMNGNIDWSIGKEQARIKKRINSYNKQFSKLRAENTKIEYKLKQLGV